ncbi:uncharacterized protein V1516DRAFT_669329 [Lipomyces oligophaga]|uniref:uncharacterized protein n=1 Tax=Lipomyces oligophaga TaxID=45792 RepID=UPI0034CFEA44
MSRIIVKNLPPSLTEDKFRQHFAQHGGFITDCKLMRKWDGQSRKFGFLGFKSPEDAKEAVKFFDRTFIGFSRIEVDFAQDVKNLNTRSNSKIAKGSNEVRTSKFPEIIPNVPTNDLRLKEFLDVMKPHSNSKTWTNDDFNEVAPSPLISSFTNIASELSLKVENSDEPSEKVAEISDSMQNHDVPGSDDQQNISNTDISDLEWLHARRRLIRDTEPNIDLDNGTKTVDVSQSPLANEIYKSRNQPKEVENQTDAVLDKIKSTKRLFIRNLPFACTEQDLMDFFGPYGPIIEIHIPIVEETQKSKGLAYILFEHGDNACRVYQELDKMPFQGRLIHILPGEPKRDLTVLDEFELAKLPVKKQNAIRRKAAAAKAQFSWNSLYLNSNAVTDFLAQRMGVSKAELLDPQSSDAAVRQALAEAHTIEDAKKYFEHSGVNLSLLQNGKVPRDYRVILVKNLPVGTTKEEIQDQFAEFATVKQVLMPASNTIAIVEMTDTVGGHVAFTKLAYRRLRSSILYLEPAPKGILKSAEEVTASSEATERVSSELATPKMTISALKNLGTDLSVDSEGREHPAIGSVSLFVKNLNFKTSSSGLADSFKGLEGFIKAEVKMKEDVKSQGQFQSMGFGFVEFRTLLYASQAMKTMNGFILDGHSLEVKLSGRGRETTNNGRSQPVKENTKIIVKNLPFEATRDDIRHLFGAFGQLKTIRVPKKFDRSSRGFAFAEFISPKEAHNAMESVNGVHLLGRRLVLQYATGDAEDAEEEIDRMTARVRKQRAGEEYAAIAGSGGRKRLKNDTMDE